MCTCIMLYTILLTRAVSQQANINWCTCMHLFTLNKIHLKNMTLIN